MSLPILFLPEWARMFLDSLSQFPPRSTITAEQALYVLNGVMEFLLAVSLSNIDTEDIDCIH